jgi:hypothetical protein
LQSPLDAAIKDGADALDPGLEGLTGGEELGWLLPGDADAVGGVPVKTTSLGREQGRQLRDESGDPESTG